MLCIYTICAVRWFTDISGSLVGVLVGAAVGACGAALVGVDASSALEVAGKPGVKDHAVVAAYVSSALGAASCS